MNLTNSAIGIVCVCLFLLAYGLVIAEEKLRLKKSIPMAIAAGLIWVLVGVAFRRAGHPALAGELLRHTILEYGELFLFLLSAITFVNTMEERQVFDVLRTWLIRRGLSLRGFFWITGGLAFAISPIADNLTTALVLGAVALSVGADNPRFVSVACINVVVAANAGGAFSPFGDITTLMVWQKGVVPFAEFFVVFLPSLVNWLVPASIMSLTVPRQHPTVEATNVVLRPGAWPVILLFLTTLVGTVLLHLLLHLPPVLGMMTGLGALKLYSYLLQRSTPHGVDTLKDEEFLAGFEYKPDPSDTFDIFKILERVEWDTLMFFYGVLVCVGGLGALGYLTAISQALYGGLGPTVANILIGFLSAFVDNIPMMYAVLSMNPTMPHYQWLLVTLATGVGGSLLSVGSAAGVALMGQAPGKYTFFSHLKWSWAIGLGYGGSIALHLLINQR
jgi:Na+/H+ antiporter NhaD/arsenite permease-like protein